MVNLILEDTAKKFMSFRETLLKNKLIKLLRQNHHAKYAKRLELFDVNIVSLKADPDFTAAISFDTGTILISEGFLKDPKTFYQLDMLMRHELSHNLLMHQIRMTKEIGEEIYPEFAPTLSMHDLLNIIEDFDISNTRYTEADKEIVRHTWLNGREIQGLVTEDVRQDWENLSLEEMYNELSAELDEIKNYILHNRLTDAFGIDYNGKFTDLIKGTAFEKGTFNYILGRNQPSTLTSTVEEFMNGKGGFYQGANNDSIKLGDFPEFFQKMFKKLYAIVTDSDSYYKDVDNLKQLISEITTSSVTDPFKVIRKDINGNEDPSDYAFLISPEEKYFAIDVLKSLAGNNALVEKPKVKVNEVHHSQEYVEIYNKIISELSYASDEDVDSIVQQLMQELN